MQIGTETEGQLITTERWGALNDDRSAGEGRKGEGGGGVGGGRLDEDGPSTGT